MTFPVHLHTGWLDYAPALHWHAARRVRSVLSGFASHIRVVTVRISRELPGADSRRCVVEIALRDGGSVIASATGAHPYELVDRTVDAVLTEVRRRVAASIGGTRLSRIA